ncbi:MAG: putative quinol monooxygenase [Flavobacteriales bacterium]
MITRIVRMEFREDAVAAFLETFRKSENLIRNFEGCKSLQLMRDKENHRLYSTVSVWENTEALEKYRESVLFKETWAAAKKGFSSKPLAFTLVGDVRA